MASEMNCSNCDQAYGPDDMFCENCGYDFLTGSLPPDLEGVPGAPVEGDSPAEEGIEAPDVASLTESEVEEADAEQAGAPTESREVERTKFEISVDRTFFDQVVTGGEIDFPSDPVPTQAVEVAGDEIHIGRTSESRAIHPDLDIADLTNDQAVSSRHAVVRVVGEGKFQLIDVGSTNGTFLESPASEPVEQGEPLDLSPGVPFFVGAWTRLTVVIDG